MPLGIVGFGAYVPRYRIKGAEIAKAWNSAARGERAVAGSDEDVVTMGVEAASNAVAVAGVDPVTELDAIFLGTSSSPFAEGSASGMLAEVLGTARTIQTAEFSNTSRGSVAVLAAFDAVASGRINRALVVGADERRAAPGTALEATLGAAAAAFVVGREHVVAELETTASVASRFIDRWRGDGDPHVHEHDPRYTREYGYFQHVAQAVQSLLAKMGRGIGDYQFVVAQLLDAGQLKRVAGLLKAKPEQLVSFVDVIGDVGAAAVPLGVVAALSEAQPGDRILAVSYGAGASDALSLVVTPEIEDVRDKARSLTSYLNTKRYVDYLTYLKMEQELRDPGEVARFPLHPATPLLWRSGPDLYRPLGGKCCNCGFINYPPSDRKICVRCGSSEFNLVPLARRGKVYTYSIGYYNPPGLDSPLALIVGDLEDGSRYWAQGTEFDLQTLKIDSPIEFVLRRMGAEQGVPVYGYKFREVEQ